MSGATGRGISATRRRRGKQRADQLSVAPPQASRAGAGAGVQRLGEARDLITRAGLLGRTGQGLLVAAVLLVGMVGYLLVYAAGVMNHQPSPQTRAPVGEPSLVTPQIPPVDLQGPGLVAPGPELALPSPEPPAAPLGGSAAVSRHVATDQKVVFVTIDDGWVRDPRVLELIRSTHLPVSLFVLERPATDGLQYFRELQSQQTRFNLNVLTRINRELGADFDLDAFAHRAFYNPARSRIEMHLQSLARQKVRVARRAIPFRAGETIHTENSYKYTLARFAALAAAAGWETRAVFTDPAEYFSVHALTQS